jgi:hypothetical protein
MINDRIPVTTLEELDSLNEDEILQGYLSGRQGSAAPGDDKSKSFWHGWRNGMIDSGHMISDREYYLLATLVVNRNKK